MASKKRATFALLCVCFSRPPAVSAQDDALYAAARAEFQRDYAAVLSGTADPDTADSEALQRYPLYPYLQSARLKYSLARTTTDDQRPTALDTAVAQFLQGHGNEPVTRDLRRDWLARLADRKQWELFLEHFREETGDTALQCQAINARIELKRTAKLETAIAPLWLAAKESPPECNAAFDWLHSQSQLTPDLIEQRARLALAGGNAAFARRLAVDLPPPRRSLIEQWAALVEKPQVAVDALIADPNRTVEPAALLDGWTRLARQNPDAAILRYDALLNTRGLRASQEDSFALALALALAWNRRTEALEYFARVQNIDTDDRAYEWYARSALWAGKWERADALINSMPATLKNQPRWRYWAARTLEQLKARDKANAIYASLLSEDNYYGVLAAARLNERYAPHPQKISVDDTRLAQAAQQPAMLRAHELLLCNLRPLATVEWLYGYALLAPPLQSQTVALASKWGWYDQAIATATRQSAFYDYALLYPRPFDQAAKSAARAFALEPEILYAILRQESLYRPDAVSSAGAYGLLQLKPETARRMSQRIRKPLKSTAELFEPEVNIHLGAAELRGLLDQFDGQLPVALAAYNAGPAAALRWLPRGNMEADVWIENIPYNETRNYVQRVLWHNVVFTWLGTRESHKNLAWLTPIKRGDAG